jgi:hypothetical protein
MKTSLTRQRNIHGSTLLVTMGVCTILGILMAGYLTLVNSHHRAVVRSGEWQQSIVVAEAGIEEALAHLNTDGVSTNNLAVHSWSDLGGGNYQKQTVVGDRTALVTIKIGPAVTNAYPVIVASSEVVGPVAGPKVFRTVQVLTKPKPLIPTPGAMVVVSTVNFAGSGITTDSFDSSNTNYSTGGMYDSKKALDHGDVCTISSTANLLNVGNGKVKGMVRTGPEGQATVGSVGSVGDMSWVNSGKQGIEAGHFADDINTDLPAATLPPNTTWLPPVAGKYTVNGTTYKYSLDGKAPWIIPNLDGSLYVAKGDNAVYVTSSIKIGSGMQIRVAPGAKLTIYMGGANASIAGQGVVNETGLAQSFTYYGLPANTQLVFGANAAFVGTIYAPSAAFTLGGGGNNTYDFIGQCVTLSAKMNGHYNFHFDEALKKVKAPTGFVASAWNEL